MTTRSAKSPVSSHNEWDPLEEVIVGTPAGAMVPTWDTIQRALLPSGSWDALIQQLFGGNGRPYPQAFVEAAERDLEELIGILRSAGVVVRRPDPIDNAASFATPAWRTHNGFSAANPRDAYLVVGDEIIEAPMADRSRYFEGWACRSLFKDYFEAGARWSAAPKPQLLSELFDDAFEPARPGEPMRYVVNEFEPTFDAADFVRCGRDIFGQLSHVTNRFGIEWLRRHLGPDYRVHTIESRNPHAMHIDDTLMPLCPGKVLVNPEYLDPEKLPDVLASWDVLLAPSPVYTDENRLGEHSGWMNMNVLMLDPQHVIVERNQEPTMRALDGWGFTVIPCSFESYYLFVGSFHCATLDVRRRGTLESYF